MKEIRKRKRGKLEKEWGHFIVASLKGKNHHILLIYSKVKKEGKIEKRKDSEENKKNREWTDQISWKSSYSKSSTSRKRTTTFC